MPAKSMKQARFARMCEHADHPPAKCPKRGALKHFEKMKPSHRMTMLKGEHR